jgi:hypothetical protein
MEFKLLLRKTTHNHANATIPAQSRDDGCSIRLLLALFLFSHSIRKVLKDKANGRALKGSTSAKRLKGSTKVKKGAILNGLELA